MAQAIAKTKDAYIPLLGFIGGGGGGGGSNNDGDGSNESTLSPWFKKWAYSIIGDRAKIFNKLADPSLRQCMENNDLTDKLYKIPNSESVACQVIRDRSEAIEVFPISMLKLLMPN